MDSVIELVQLPSGLVKMKTVLALTCLAFALAGASVVPQHHDYKVQNGIFKIFY